MEIIEGSKIIGRIMKALGLKRQEALASFLGIDPSSISTYKKREDIRENWYLKLAHTHGLNPDYLRTGVGEPFSRQVEAQLPSCVPPAMVQIPLISGEFTTKGAFKPLPASRNQVWFSPERVRGLSEFPEKLLMLEFHGNHMAPDVQEDDLVIFDQNRTYPEARALAVTRIEDSMTVHRIMIGAGEVLFHSSDGHTPPVSVPRERLGTVQAEILGRVVGVIRLEKKG